MSRNVLITGASGFVGKNLVFHLSANSNFRIVANGRKKVDYFNHLPNVVYEACDFTVVSNPLQFDICIHCAAKVDDKGSFSDFFIENVKKTEDLIKRMKTDVLFIYISSSSVYNFADSCVKKENDTFGLNKLSAYGKTKRMAEECIIQNCTNYVILRPRAVYGPGDTTLLPRVLKLIKKYLVFLPGSPQVKTSLTNIFLLCNVVEYFSKQRSDKKEIFNIADKQTYFLHDIIRHIAQKYGRNDLFVRIPNFVLVLITELFRFFPIKHHLTKQAVSNFCFDSVVNTSALENIINWDHKSFFDEDCTMEM